MNQVEPREQFLNYKIKLINEVLGIDFVGETLYEKEVFYEKYKEQINQSIEKLLNEMHTAFTAKVIRFGNGSYETDWVVAETKEQAIEYYEMNSMRSIEDIEIHEVNTELEFILFEQVRVPEYDWSIFKKSEKYDGFLEVPFVYAIDYALQDGMKLPNIIQSFE